MYVLRVIDAPMHTDLISTKLTCSAPTVGTSVVTADSGITGPVGDGAAASRLSIEVRIQEDLAEPVGSGCTKMKRP